MRRWVLRGLLRLGCCWHRQLMYMLWNLRAMQTLQLLGWC